MACGDLLPYHHPQRLGKEAPGTLRFFQRKSDKEDVARFIVDEVRRIEAEISKDQITVRFSRVVKNFDIAEFFPEQTTESRSGRDRDKVRRLKVGLNWLLLSNNHFGIFVSYFDLLLFEIHLDERTYVWQFVPKHFLHHIEGTQFHSRPDGNGKR